MIYETRINLRNKTKEELILFVNEGLETISKYETELEKKDRIIEKMAKDITISSATWKRALTTQEKIKYYENKVEREGK